MYVWIFITFGWLFLIFSIITRNERVLKLSSYMFLVAIILALLKQ